MSTLQDTGRWPAITTTLVVAFLLVLLPWRGGLLDVRPDFLLVVGLFWVLHSPERVGFALLFALGLLTDFLDGVVLGQHALAYVVGAYLVLQLRLRLLRFDPVRQAVQMLPVFLALQLVVFLVGWLVVRPPEGLMMFVPVILHALLWFGLAWWMLLGRPHRRAGRM